MVYLIQRCINVMNMCTNVQRPVLLVGEMGVGKTLLMREKLRNSQALEGLQVTLNCDKLVITRISCLEKILFLISDDDVFIRKLRPSPGIASRD